MDTRITQLNEASPACFAGETVNLLLTLAQKYGCAHHGHSGTEFVEQLRFIVDAFSRALHESEHTVSFRHAAEFSLTSRSHRRPSTVADLRSYVNRMYAEPGFADKPIRSISIEESRCMLVKQFSHSAHSFRKAQSILHSIFNCAIRQRWCEYNPAKAILRPPVREAKIEILTRRQISELVRCCCGIEKLKCMNAPLRLMLWCGIRPMEVRRLRWGDVDAAEKVVYVESENSKTGGARAVPLRGGALALLKERHDIQSMIAPQDWNRLWRLLRIAAGFRTWQADALRHTFASMHLKRFHNIYLLQQEMGHRNTTLLQTRYLNLRGLSKAAACQFFSKENWS